jgi:cytochrome c553
VEQGVMKIIGLQLALPAAILAIVFSLAGGASGSDRGRAAREHPQGKLGYCMDCHGMSGQGYHGYLVMPRLAGQTPEYLENQLRAFVEHRRDRGLFINMARVHGVSPELRSSLAAQLRSFNPKPFGGGPRNAVETGRKIFEEGVPEANVPACAACHGPEGQGEGANARLAGQLFSYTVNTLKNWSKERTGDSASIMAPVARSLSQSDIVAVAAYMSYLH